MPQTNRKSQETENIHEMICINSALQELSVPTQVTRICWNTGEEKNCAACYLSKGCKAK